MIRIHSRFAPAAPFRTAGFAAALAISCLFLGNSALHAQVPASPAPAATSVSVAVPPASPLEIPGTPDPPETSFSSSAAASLSTSPDLPEAPSPQDPAKMPPDVTGARSAPLAPRLDGVIPAGMQARPLDARGKVAVGVGELVNVEGLAAMILSAGYEQALNSEPNYGTDRGAFGARLGAAALREESQAVFTYMLLAPLFHQDARYYVEGPTFSLKHRVLYAISRPLITRNDNGRNEVNSTLLLGYAASAALTPTYYPSSNRNFHDVLSVYGGSIGGAALGFAVNEFTDDTLEVLHLKHKP